MERLPPRQRDALRCAFGTDEIDASRTPDQLLIRLGVLTLLSGAASERPLLIAVDDAQWLDVGSLDVLAFVARRLEGEPAAMLLAARDEAVPARFDHDFPHLTAGPLDRAAAGLLLDAQPHPPKGRVRSQILRQAAGNPLALIELTRAFARDPAGRDIGSVDTLPVTARLERLFAADLHTLPESTRRVLLLAAAAGTERLSDVLHAAPLAHLNLEIFERLDARPWVERTAAELRAAGVAVVPAVAPDSVSGMTPQELQIARLAAEGLTNRDIGARLYLSPRTIGFHLHKIFPKLGITGRAQLRDALGDLPRPD